MGDYPRLKKKNSKEKSNKLLIFKKKVATHQATKNRMTAHGCQKIKSGFY